MGEAMSMGLPCISTDVGDTAVLMGKSEWTVLARNASTLSLKYQQMLIQPKHAPKRSGCTGIS
jgi:hypothetical protein